MRLPEGIDEESFLEIVKRWQRVEDEVGWLESLYLKHGEEEDYPDGDSGYYLGSDLRKWDSWPRTASSPSLGWLWYIQYM